MVPPPLNSVRQVEVLPVMMGVGSVLGLTAAGGAAGGAAVFREAGVLRCLSGIWTEVKPLDEPSG